MTLLTPMTLNLLTGICLALAGFAVGLRQILLSPKLSTFPCAPREVRAVMFIMAVALAGLAMKFLGEDGHTLVPWAGQAAMAIAVLAGIVAIYNVVLLVNVIAQRLPAGVWTRVNRYEANARRVKAASR